MVTVPRCVTANQCVQFFHRLLPTWPRRLWSQSRKHRSHVAGFPPGVCTQEKWPTSDFPLYRQPSWVSNRNSLLLRILWRYIQPQDFETFSQTLSGSTEASCGTRRWRLSVVYAAWWCQYDTAETCFVGRVRVQWECELHQASHDTAVPCTKRSLECSPVDLFLIILCVIVPFPQPYWHVSHELRLSR